VVEVAGGHQANADQAAYWNGPGGQRWADCHGTQEIMLEPIAQILLRRALPQEGEHVLDIGCGAGATTVAAARAVSPGGRVLGVDISEPMLVYARRNAPGDLPIDFVLADASVHGFEPLSFDLLISRFGVMFFADPVASFANLRRALKSQARMVFTCWREPRANPWMMVPLQAVYQHVAKMAPVGPEDPGPFAFAQQERVEHILKDAGFTAVTVERTEVIMDLAIGEGLEIGVERALQVGPASLAIEGQSAELREAARNTVREALRPFVCGQSVAMPGSMWLVSATV